MGKANHAKQLDMCGFLIRFEFVSWRFYNNNNYCQFMRDFDLFSVRNLVRYSLWHCGDGCASVVKTNGIRIFMRVWQISWNFRILYGKLFSLTWSRIRNNAAPRPKRWIKKSFAISGDIDRGSVFFIFSCVDVILYTEIDSRKIQ